MKVLNDLNDTRDLAERLAKIMTSGDILCLTGDLGAGKTTLTQHLVRSLGVTEPVTSPTFTLVNTYDAPTTVHHFDVYRISDSEELYDIGYEEYFFGDAICIIEWASRIEELLPKEAIWLHLQFNDSGERTVSWDHNDPSVIKRVEEVLSC